jgi:hypothetical protein
MNRTTKERNRKIFAGYSAGKTPDQLAQTHGLGRATVMGIIGIERHRLEVSVDRYYEELRSSLGLEPLVLPKIPAE